MQFHEVRKRNGDVVKFNAEKITNAIAKAGKATEEFDLDVAKQFTNKVLSIAQISLSGMPTVEQIQDIVEEVLLNSPFRSTAKAYTIYRDQHSKIREIKTSSGINMIDQYLDQIDWQVNENSNMAFSLQGLNNYISSEVSKLYWLNKIYPKEVRDAHNKGDLHIHDLNLLSVYCVGWDLYDLLLQGFKGAAGKIESEPAKHFSVALGQVVNFFYTLQGEAAGAQAFSNFDTLLAPFIAYDGLTYNQVKQALQGFVFNINVPTRVGFQTPFTNITMDLQCPEFYRNQGVVIGGEIQDRKYSEFQNEMDMLNMAFMEVMAEGDAAGRVFTFPIPTYNITADFNWENPNLENLWKMTARYGIPYFSNFVNSDMSPDDARSMCPLHGLEEVWTKEDTCVCLNRLEDLYTHKQNEIIMIQSGRDFVPATIAKYDDQDMIKVTLVNESKISMSKTHLNFARRQESLETEILTGAELIIGMYLPIEAEDGEEWIKIEDIEELGKGTGYCFQVEEGYEPKFTVAGSCIITHNCRLRIDNRELNKRGGGLFGSNPLTGSVGVVTINLPRLGYVSKNKEELLKRLDRLIEVASTSLEIKRKVLERYTEGNLYPYTKHYLHHIKERFGEFWKNHFSTIGIVGMNEMCLNLIGSDIGSDEGKALALEVSDFIREKLIKLQERTGNNYNFEATPAEGTSYRLAQKDKEKYPEIICANEDGDFFYTNSSLLPVNYTDDLFEVLDLQDELQTKYTGGTVIHLYAGEQIHDTEVVKNLVKRICTSYKLPYFSFSPTFSVCSNHGYLNGEQEVCPHCGATTEIYSRVVGYLRPVAQWNKGKKEEFKMRKEYVIKENC